MQHLKTLPIWRDANRLLLAVEQAVRHFSRYHKYSLGSDLRRQAMDICRLIHRAASVSEAQEVQEERVAELVLAVDDFKLSLQLGKELQAFRSFQEFQNLAELAVSVGRQSGGWRKRLRTRNTAESIKGG